MKMPRRSAFKISIEYDFGEAGDTFRKFLFSYECAYEKVFQDYPVFWIRGWIRILGLSIGGGVFYRISNVKTPNNREAEGGS